MRCIVAVLFLLLIDRINQSNGLCNTCSGLTGLACVTQTSFKICENGTLNQNATEVNCPVGTFCTPNAYVCSPSNLPAACAKCGECLDGSAFGCVSYDSFAFCLEDGSVDTSMNYTCPTGLVCNSGSTPICANATITGIGSQCPWVAVATTTTTTTTTTPAPAPAPIPDPIAETALYCAYLAVPGRYGVPNDTTCHTFISCVSSGGNMTGNIFECPQNTYFNGTSQKCGPNKPTICV